MQTRFIARRIELTDELRGYIENHIGKVAALMGNDDSVEARVVLSSQKFRYTADLTLAANGFTVNAKEETKDVRASVDGALGKLVRQIKKKKARIARHQPISAREARRAEQHVPETDIDTEFDDDDVSGLALERLRTVNRESLPVKPMHVDEAMMQLDLIDEEFLAFSNAETNEVNVVYARENGAYGLIEPES